MAKVFRWIWRRSGKECSANFPSSLLAKQFKDDNGVGYGDSKVKLKDLDGEAFDGDTLTVELPFETIKYERLTDRNTGGLTTVQVGNVIDIDYAPVFTEPHLHYAAKIRINDLDNRISYQGTVLEDYILRTVVFLFYTHLGPG